ncbi:MAG: PAS domain S-box protein [Rhodocyclaceae bacterium]|nr:MAG: PAS domain S-box protein [Rhodocyclaceae bacterium]
MDHTAWSFAESAEIQEDESLSSADAHALLEIAAIHRIATDVANDAIIMIDNEARISLWNRAAERVFGYSFHEAMGQEVHALIAPQRYHAVSAKAFEHFKATGEGAALGKLLELTGIRKGGTEFPLELSLSAENFKGRWIAVATARDISDRKHGEQQVQAQGEHLEKVNAELVAANTQLKDAQNQLLQSEKMASIGLLAAGVAHEINNPIGYVYSNLGTLEKYLADIFAVVRKYEAAEHLMDGHAEEIEDVRQFKAQVDLDYLKEDIQSLLAESREGLMRVRKIVRDLKDFSHIGSDEEWQWADVKAGLESTLGVVWNELKYKCEVVKEYADLPLILCLPSQLNQVFMNLMVNAAQAIEVHGIVTLRTGQEEDQIWVEIADTGKGVAPENLARLFDPFFTTKPVGLGTGLGLSVSYSIVEKHHGKIEVHSELGKGATFRVWLPVKQAVGTAAGLEGREPANVHAQHAAKNDHE